MSIIDIILGSLLLFGLIRGFTKGFFVEIASLLALILGVYGAIHFSFYVSNYLNNHVDWNQKTISIVAFSITFVVILIAIGLAGKVLTKVANFAALGILNKILGGFFGILKIGLILSVVLVMLSRFNNSLQFFSTPDLEKSVLYKPLKSVAPAIFPNIIRNNGELNIPKAIF